MIALETNGIKYVMSHLWSRDRKEAIVTIYDVTGADDLEEALQANSIVAQYHCEGPHALLEAVISFLDLLAETSHV